MFERTESNMLPMLRRHGMIFIGSESAYIDPHTDEPKSLATMQASVTCNRDGFQTGIELAIDDERRHRLVMKARPGVRGFEPWNSGLSIKRENEGC